jgi:nucleotide sugar dehydrogenase
MALLPDVDRICVKLRTPLSEILQRQANGPTHGLPAGIAVVVDDQRRVVGVITDGDVRRGLLRHGTLDVRAEQLMSAEPILFPLGSSYREILERLPEELARRGRRSRRFLSKIVLVDAHARPVRILDYHELWEQRVATHRHLVVVGLGYVGLTLALELAREGFLVTGVDTDRERVQALARGESYVVEPGIEEILREQLGRNFVVAETVPKEGEVFVVAVGTPVGGADVPVPQLGPLHAAIDQVSRCLRRGDLVILRSTVPIGCTRGEVLPRLESGSGLVGGKDFHLAFAPERTAEGKALEELRSLPQLIGGLNDDSQEAAVAVFRELTPTIVRVPSLEAAEMAKLINNAFRDLVFSFANKMTQIGEQWNLDVADVIESANRGYPRDRIPMPSPGVGGPCLTKDPHILAASLNEEMSLFRLGREINESMHRFVVDMVLGELHQLGKEPEQVTLLICGLAFKGYPETADLRNSCSVEIARQLQSAGVRVFAHDPVASSSVLEEFGFTAVPFPEVPRGLDGILFLNNHPSYARADLPSVVRQLDAPGLIFDGWHVFRPGPITRAAPCSYLGLGMRVSSAGPDGV